MNKGFGLRITVDGIENVKKAVVGVRGGIHDSIAKNMAKSAKRIARDAKRFLEEASLEYTDKRYWTGALKESIQVVREDDSNYAVTAGGGSIDYAEAVEFGHFSARGGMPIKSAIKYGKTSYKEAYKESKRVPGYHFMEKAYIEATKKMYAEVAKGVSLDISKFAIQAGRVSDTSTGRFRTGFGGLVSGGR
jgi:hypothetical protein